METPPEQPDIGRPETPGLAARLIIPLLLVVLGVALLAVLSRIEAAYLLRQKWSDGVLIDRAAQSEPADPGILPVAIRRLPAALSPMMSEIVSQLLAMPQGDEIVAELGLGKGPYVVAAPIDQAFIAGLLESGRPPEPGAYEAAAGDLVKSGYFELDGKVFEVVGRLKRAVGGFSYAYLVPEHPTTAPLFSPESGATAGYYDPAGLPKLRQRQFENVEDTEAIHPVIAATRATEQVAVGSLLALLIIALGGSIACYQVLTWLAVRARFPRCLLRAVGDRRPIFVFVNVLLYAAFFAAMMAALNAPLTSLRLAGYIGREFAEGDLSFVGQAYRSGNVYLAAVATFAQNFLQATCLYTLLPSLFIPCIGLFKNLVTFGMVGFVMSPQWTGSAPTLVYHSITMILEFEAYIIASFAVVLFPVSIVEGIRRSAVVEGFKTGFRILSGAVVVTGVILAVAAIYEAATVILLR